MKRSIAQKALALVLSAMLLLAPLSGCQGRDDPSEPSSSSQSSSEEPSSSSSQEESSSSLRAEPSSVPPVTSSSSSSRIQLHPCPRRLPLPSPYAIPAGSVTKVVVSNGGHETYDDVITVTGQEDITALVQLFNGFADSVQKERIDPHRRPDKQSGLLLQRRLGGFFTWLCTAAPPKAAFTSPPAASPSQYTTNSPPGCWSKQNPGEDAEKIPHQLLLLQL